MLCCYNGLQQSSHSFRQNESPIFPFRLDNATINTNRRNRARQKQTTTTKSTPPLAYLFRRQKDRHSAVQIGGDFAEPATDGEMFLPRPSMSGLLPLVPGDQMKSRRSLLLLLATLLYLVVGAMLFSLFEYEEDLRARREVAKRRRELQKKYGFSKKDFALMEQMVVQSIPHSAGYQWQFLGSLYFCTIVITTIGYGHSTPNTVAGKLFCMFYALGGIPLGLVMFQSVGERINYGIRTFLYRVGCWLRRRAGMHLLDQVKSAHLLCVSFCIGWLTIAVATGVFHQRERWSIFDAVYYCMITLSTIGFGDFVPAQTSDRLENEPGYVLFTLFFILFGLAIFSACINLLILECMAYNADIVTARTRLKRMISIRMSTSFRIVTGQNGIAGARQAIQRSRVRRGMAIRRRGESAPASRKTGVVVEKIENSPPSSADGRRRRSRSVSISILRDIYRQYYWKKPTHFCARRLPTPYIEHLVNTRGSSRRDRDGGDWERCDFVNNI